MVRLVVAAAGVTGSAGLIAEGALRFSGIPDAFAFTRANAVWRERHVSLNAAGFRDDPWGKPADKPGTTWRIGVVGSATTFGQGVEHPADRFTDRLETALARRGDTLAYQVWNLARPGWTTEDQLTAFKAIVPRLHLDEIVLVYAMSDAQDLTFTGAALQSLASRRPAWQQWIGRHSVLLDLWFARPLLASGLRVSYGGVEQAYRERRYWTFQAGRLRLFATMARELQIPLRVVVVPMLGATWEGYRLRKYHARVAAVFDDLDVPTLDVLPILDKVPARSLWVGPLDLHPNERAHRLIADAMVERWWPH